MTDTDEGNGFGWLLLKCAKGQRRWAVGTPYSLAIINGGATTIECTVPVSRRLVQFAACEVGEISLVVNLDDLEQVQSMSVHGSSGSVEVEPAPAHPHDYFEVIAKRRRSEVGVTVSASMLTNALYSILATRQDRSSVFGKLTVDDGQLTIAVDVANIGTTKCHLAGTSKGHGFAMVELAQLMNLVRFHREDVCIHIPDTEGGLVFLKSPDAEGLLTPVPSSKEQVRPQVEAAIREVYGQIAIHRDHDDDYRLVRRGTPVFGRLIDGKPTRLQVFAVLLDEIDASPELYVELNDYNVELGYVRVAHLERQIWAVVDLMAETMQIGELKTAVEQIAGVAEKLAPMLQLRFGGEADAAEDVRWEAYANTVVMAEVHPGKFVPLNGPDAEREWPFDDVVHCITAWDPQGVHRSTKENESANQALAADLLFLDLHFVHAYGAGLDHHGEEPGFLIWGTNRELARQLGETYDQDAIFEISPNSISVISCFDDRVFTKGRFD